MSVYHIAHIILETLPLELPFPLKKGGRGDHICSFFHAPTYRSGIIGEFNATMKICQFCHTYVRKSKSYKPNFTTFAVSCSNFEPSIIFV